eukprot:2076033-Lingulodinium_polyedra.AAC.2
MASQWPAVGHQSQPNHSRIVANCRRMCSNHYFCSRCNAHCHFCARLVDRCPLRGALSVGLFSSSNIPSD